MSDAGESFFERVNHARYRAGQPADHYEMGMTHWLEKAEAEMTSLGPGGGRE